MLFHTQVRVSSGKSHCLQYCLGEGGRLSLWLQQVENRQKELKTVEGIMFFFLNQKLLYVLYTRYSMQAQVQLEQPERNESPQPWELWKRTRDRGLQGQVFHFFYHLAKGNSTSLICKGTLVFTGALGRGNMTTILDDPPTDHLMGGAMIGLSRFTWRFSGLNFYWVSSLLMSF